MPAPESVLEMMVCECQKSACRDTCQCRIFRLECTDLCKSSGSCDKETETNDIESEKNSAICIRVELSGIARASVASPIVSLPTRGLAEPFRPLAGFVTL